MTTLRNPKPHMAAAGGLAPPFTGSKPAVLLLDDTAINWSGRQDLHLHDLRSERSRRLFGTTS